MSEFLAKYKWYIIAGLVALAFVTAVWNGGI